MRGTCNMLLELYRLLCFDLIQTIQHRTGDPFSSALETRLSQSKPFSQHIIYTRSESIFLSLFQNCLKSSSWFCSILYFIHFGGGYYTVGRFVYSGVSDYEWNSRIQHIDLGFQRFRRYHHFFFFSLDMVSFFLSFIAD